MRKLREIVDLLRSDDDVYDIIKDCNLISAVAFYDNHEDISRWELIFYNPLENKTYKIDVLPSNDYEIYESELMDEKFKEVSLDVSALGVDESEALKRGFEHFMEAYKNKEIKGMFVALDVINQTWNINLITPYFSVIQISVDVFDGSIVGSKEVQLVHEA